MTIISVLFIASLIAVLASLFIGLFSFIKGGAYAKKHANALMRARIFLQGLALLLFFIMLWLKS